MIAQFTIERVANPFFNRNCSIFFGFLALVVFKIYLIELNEKFITDRNNYKTAEKDRYVVIIFSQSEPEKHR